MTSGRPSTRPASPTNLWASRAHVPSPRRSSCRDCCIPSRSTCRETTDRSRQSRLPRKTPGARPPLTNSTAFALRRPFVPASVKSSHQTASRDPLARGTSSLPPPSGHSTREEVTGLASPTGRPRSTAAQRYTQPPCSPAEDRWSHRRPAGSLGCSSGFRAHRRPARRHLSPSSRRCPGRYRRYRTTECVVFPRPCLYESPRLRVVTRRSVQARSCSRGRFRRVAPAPCRRGAPRGLGWRRRVAAGCGDR